MKNLYWFQMILNWSWSFVFFAYKEFGLSLLIIIVMVVSVAAIIYTASGSQAKPVRNISKRCKSGL